LTVAAFATSPRTPRAGRPFSASARLMTDAGRVVSSGRVTCTATLGTRRLQASRRGFRRRLVIRGPVAACTWRIPPRTAGKLLKATIRVKAGGSSASRAFSRRVGA
jgi:hypothetical protein